MADVVTELAERAGISPEMAKKGVGAVLSFLKGKIPAEGFAKVTNAVPGADSMMAAAEAGPKESGGGGVLGAISDLAGKVFGGGSGGGADIFGKLSQLGLSPERHEEFLAHALDVLKSKLPDDVHEHITGSLPTQPAGPRGT